MKPLFIIILIIMGYLYVNHLYAADISKKIIDDVQIMKNSVESNKIEKQIIKLDKKLVLNRIYTKVVTND